MERMSSGKMWWARVVLGALFANLESYTLAGSENTIIEPMCTVPYAVLRDGKEERYLLRITPENRHVFWTDLHDGHTTVYLDDRLLGTYDDVPGGWWPSFDPSGHHVAWLAKRAGRELVASTIDGDGPLYDEIIELFFFTTQGHRLVYIARDGNRWYYINQGVVAKKYDCPISELYVSNVGDRVVYQVQRGNKRSVVIDGTEGPAYDDVSYEGTHIFSPDARRTAYTAKRNGKYFAIIDGVETKEHDWVKGPWFTQDSRHVVYQTRDGRVRKVVIDDGDGWTSGIVDSRPFSPTGDKVAVECEAEYETPPYVRRYISVYDLASGQCQHTGEYAFAAQLAFSPDGSRMAFTASRELGNETGAFAVIDGKEQPEYDAIMDSGYEFSPDGSMIAYVAKRKGKYVVVINGTESAPYDGVYGGLGTGAISFSPGTKKWAYSARAGADSILVVNGQAAKEYRAIDGILPPRGGYFSPDGNHMAYWVKRGGKWAIVFDGRERGEFDGLLRHFLARQWRKDQSIVFVAHTGNRIIRVFVRP